MTSNLVNIVDGVDEIREARNISGKAQLLQSPADRYVSGRNDSTVDICAARQQRTDEVSAAR